MKTLPRADSATDLRHELTIPVGGSSVEGTLEIPAGALDVVLFAHGSGSSRHSSRNQQVAAALRAGGVGTFLFDLLTPAEERIEQEGGSMRFDIELLAERLRTATHFLRAEHDDAIGSFGYFGASTGAAAALVAAALEPVEVKAVVSRGGRPDLAGDALVDVIAPTLLIVGGNDEPVLGLNRGAFRRLPGEKQLAIVPGATHLFEEPGALERVAALATGWFVRQLPHTRPAPS